MLESFSGFRRLFFAKQDISYTSLKVCVGCSPVLCLLLLVNDQMCYLLTLPKVFRGILSEIAKTVRTICLIKKVDVRGTHLVKCSPYILFWYKSHESPFVYFFFNDMCFPALLLLLTDDRYGPQNYPYSKQKQFLLSTFIFIVIQVIFQISNNFIMCSFIINIVIFQILGLICFFQIYTLCGV
jgi:hypothetical protein